MRLHQPCLWAVEDLQQLDPAGSVTVAVCWVCNRREPPNHLSAIVQGVQCTRLAVPDLLLDVHHLLHGEQLSQASCAVIFILEHSHIWAQSNVRAG